MSQTPVNITYSLDEVLKQINGKLDKLQEDVTEMKMGQVKLEGKIEAVETKLTGKIETLETKLTAKIETLETELKGEIKTLETKLTGKIETLSAEVQGIGKRSFTQEFINRSVVVGFVLVIAVAALKLFFPNFPN